MFSVLVNQGLISQNVPIFNLKPLLPNINTNIKFEENWSINAQDREQKLNFSKSRAVSLYLFDKIYQTSIQNHSFLISTPIYSLKTIGQYMLKIEPGNKILT